ncbi:MAG: ECF transporter S component [Roseburia sp.]
MKAETSTVSASESKSNIQFLVVTAIFIALTYLFTAFINVRLPIAANGGLIHLGNVPLFIGAIIFGKKTGMIAGGVGMGLFDLLSGWTLWAPFTLVIVGIMGYVVGRITEKPSHQKFGWYVVAIGAALVIKIVGYYIAEAILYKSLVAPVTSIPGNVVQILVAAVIVLIIITPLNAAAKKVGLK